MGLETFHLTSPRQGPGREPLETVEGLQFYRTPVVSSGLAAIPLAAQIADMRQLEKRLEEVVRHLRPDILHAHSPVLNAWPALRVGRRYGIPVVYEIRAFWEDAAVDHGSTREGSLRYQATRLFETAALRRADAVTCICEGLRQDIVARGIDEKKLTVIPNAVDPEKFVFDVPPDLGLAKTLGLEGLHVLGFIGSFYAYEGLDLLVKAMPSILAADRHVRLLLVGGGPQESRLRADTERLGLSRHVIFVGRIPHSDINRYYSLTDILVYPRHSMRLTELVTPLKPLEAMAQGKLFVASDVGGHRELIRHNETGILFPAGNVDALKDAVLMLLRSADSWKRLKTAGRAFIEKERTWRASIARYTALYQGLV